nr:MAG TPA: hypothetical protein [Bacteriophage sp.]
MALFLSYIGRGKLSIYYLKTHIAVQRYLKRHKSIYYQF